MSDLGKLLAEEAEHAEETRHLGPPAGVKGTRPGRDRAKVLSVRLNPEEYDRLVAAAEAHGVGPSTYARGLILKGLEPTATDVLAERVRRLEELLEGERQGVRSMR